MKQVNAVIIADLHLRGTIPQCRTDDFFSAMWKKTKQILDLALNNDCPLIIAGDIGHKSQWPNWLIEEFLNLYPPQQVWPQICIVPGQHDLPGHVLKDWAKSGIGVLKAAGAIHTIGAQGIPELPSSFNIDYGQKIKCFAYGQQITPPKNSENIALAHTLAVSSDNEWWLKDKSTNANLLLRKFPQYKLIITGDNHKTFIVEYEGRIHLNPGSVMRTNADQADHKPQAFLWYADENKIESVFLDIEENVIDRTHIDIKKHKDKRLEAYLNKMDEIAQEADFGLDYENNLKTYCAKNKTRKLVKDKVFLSLIKGEKNA